MSSTSHVIEIRFVSNTAGAVKPTTDLTKGVDTLTKSTTTLNKTGAETTNIYTQTQKSGEAYFKTTGNVTKGTATANKELSNTAKAGSEVVSANQKMTSAQDKTNQSKGRMIQTFTKFRPLIFGATGIATAGIEAVGMWGQYQSAADKVSKAQDTVNMLIAAGQQNTGEYRDAMNELTDANRSAQFAMRILILSVSDLAPMLLLSVNAMLNMRSQLAATKTATDVMATSTTNLANANKANLIPSFMDFNKVAQQTPILNAGVTKSLDTTTKSIAAQKGPLAALGAAGISTFGNIELGSRQMDSQMKKSQGVFGGFKAALMSGFTGLIGGFKGAGAAALAFGKTLLAAFSHPIVLLISAIAIAVGALMFDLGGFRTRLNEVGVALGQMAPWAKPFLDVLGMISNGMAAAGTWIMDMLGLGDATKKAGEAAQAAQNKFDPLLLSMQKVLDVGAQFENLEQVRQRLANVGIEIDNLGQKTDFFGKTTITGIGNVSNAFELFASSVTTKSAEVVKAEAEVRDIIRQVETGSLSLAEAKVKLEAAMAKYTGAIQGARKVEESQIEMHNQNTLGTTKLSTAVISLTAALQDDEVVTGENTKAREENQKAIEAWLDDMNMGIDISDKLKLELLNNVAALKTFGTQVVITDKQTVDLVATIMNVTKANEDLKAAAVDVFGSYIQQVNELGSKYLPTIQPQIDLLKTENEALGEIVQQLFDDWIANTVDVAGQIYIVNEAEEEQKKKVEDAATAIKKKADDLGYYNEVAGFTVKEQEVLVGLEDSHRKAMGKSTEQLQQLAKARGASNAVLVGEIGALQDYVKYTFQEIDIDKEVGNQLAILMAARQDEMQSTMIQTQAAQEYARELGFGNETMGMSAKGIMELVQLHDDMSNSLQIATDDVKLWMQQLKTNQAIEKDTIAQLLDMAEVHSIDIPQAIINKGIPAIKEFIEAEMGIGEAAKKAAETAKQAFDDLSNKAQDTITNLIKDDVLAGKGKKVEKVLQEIGLEVDSLAAKQAIIEVGANTVDFEDKIQSIDELIITELQGIPPRTTVEADHIITTFADSMEQELGSRIPGIGQTINDLWQQVKTDNPKAKAAELIKIFQEEILKDPVKFAEAVNQGIIDPTTGAITEGFGKLPGVADENVKAIGDVLGGNVELMNAKGQELAGSTAEGYDEGGKDLLTAGQRAMYNLLAQYGPAEQKAYLASLGIAKESGKGLEAGAGDVAKGAKTGIVDPITQNAELVPNEVDTAIAPVEGIFSQAFLDASNAAGAQLQTMVTNVHTKMSNMSTSVDTYSNSMKVNFADFLTVSGQNIDTFIPKLTTLQSAYSILSTSLATYATSMTANLNEWLLQVSLSMQAHQQVILALQNTYSTLSTSLATYATSMQTNTDAWLLNVSLSMQAHQQVVIELWDTYSNFSTSVSTYAESMQTRTNEWLLDVSLSMQSHQKVLIELWDTYSNFSESVATYMDSMTKNTQSWEQSSIESFGNTGDAAFDLQGTMSDLSSNFATYMDSMAENAEAMADDVVSAFDDIGKAAAAAEKKVRSLIEALNDLESAQSGVSSAQFGGSFFMRKGGSFIADHFMRYGGHSIGEYGKSEFVNVNPLSDPSNISQKGPGLDSGGLNNFMTNLAPSSATSMGMDSKIMNSIRNASTLGSKGGTPNVHFTGQANITIVTPTGEVQAKHIVPLTFKNVTSINLR